MADETTYDSEINQPAHRPGMESVVNRGAAPQKAAIIQSRDASGNQTQAARPSVAPGRVDPFSIKGDPAPAPTPKAAPAAQDPATGIGGRNREKTIMSQVDDAQTG